MNISILARKAVQKYRNEEKYQRLNYKTFPRRELKTKLDQEQRAAVDSMWGRLWYRPSYRWHELYLDVTGKFNPEYVPTDVFYMNVVGKLNNERMIAAWEDKALYAARFPDVRFPHSVLCCIDGNFYDDRLNYLNEKEAIARIKTYDRLLIKPSFDAGVGRGVEIFNTDTINAQGLKALIVRRNGNCVIQEIIRQHESMAKFNSSSVNMIRINLFKVKGKSEFLHATMRYGTPGYITDIVMNKDGTEIVNLVGVKEDGTLMGKVYNGKGDSFPIQEVPGYVAGEKLIDFAKAIEICKSMHQRIPHFDLAAFDVTYNYDGEPIIIECNLGNPGIVNYQYIHGPFFGVYTSYLLEKLK